MLPRASISALMVPLPMMPRSRLARRTGSTDLRLGARLAGPRCGLAGVARDVLPRGLFLVDLFAANGCLLHPQGSVIAWLRPVRATTRAPRRGRPARNAPRWGG